MIQVKNIDPPDERLVPPGMELTGEYESRPHSCGEIYTDGWVWKVAKENGHGFFIVALTRPKASVLPKCPWCGAELDINQTEYSGWWIECLTDSCFRGPATPTREQAISETIRVLGKGS